MIAGTLLAHTGAEDRLNLLVGFSVLAGAALYLAAWLRNPTRPVLRLASWLGGLGALLVAASPRIESMAAETFSWHMVQHLLLIVVAAPLLVTGAPVRVASRAVHLPSTPALRLAGRWWHRLSAVLGPVLFIVVLYTTHLTSWYDESLHNRLLHDAEHAAYLLGAAMTWAAVRGAGRSAAPARLGAAFGVSAAGALLGMILMSASKPLMPTYEEMLGATDAVADHRAAASIMWVGGMLATVPLLLIAGWRWASTEERIVRRAEELADGRGGGASA